MSIAFQCKCGRNYSVKDELAGRAVKCPCGAVSTVPAPIPVAAAATSWFDEMTI